MALVPHKITALAESDAQGTDGKNIVAGAVVSLYDTNGTAVTLFDNESGANGSTAKQTDAKGQVVVYVTPGEYDEEVNGSIKRRVTVGGNGVTSYGTTAELQSSRPSKTGQRAENRERANAQYTLAASGYTALAGDITAANGRVWELQINGPCQVENFGVFEGVDSSAEMQGAINRMAGIDDLKFSGKTYLMQGIKLLPKTVLKGSGINSTVIKLPDAAASGYIFADQGFVENSQFATTYISLSDLRLDGNKANNPSKTALLIIKGYRCSFVKINFSFSSGHGCLYTDEASGGALNINGLAENTWFKCLFNENDGAGLYGKDLNNQLADATISECIFNSNSLTSKLGDIYAERSAGFKILNNQLYAGGYHNIYLSAFSRGIVSGNHCDLDANFADSGDFVEAIKISSFSAGGAAVINNNPIFLNVDGATTGVNTCCLGLAGTSESLTVVGNALGQVGNGGFDYKIYGQQPLAVYKNSVNEGITRNDNPYDFSALDAGIFNDVFTPQFSFSTEGDSVITYTAQNGSYSRIGNTINFNIRLEFSTNNYTSASGDVRVSLPFASDEISGLLRTVAVGRCRNIQYVGTVANAISLAAYIIDGDNSIKLAFNVNGQAPQILSTGNFPPNTTFTLSISGQYVI